MVSGIIAVAVGTALAAAPVLAVMDSGMTKSDLALQLARAAGISLPADGSAQAALESLGKAGISLGTDLNAPVTGQVLVQVGLTLGVTVTTSHPEAAVTPAVSSAFLRSIKGELQNAAAVSGQSATGAVHASCQGRDSRAGRQGTPASPSDPNATAPPCGDPHP
jgi:hypothetical protein